MKTYSLEEAGWNQQMLIHLQMHGCAGMEIHWSRSSADGACVVATGATRRVLSEQGYVHQWTLISHETLQPANRITRYQGIWRPLGIRPEWLSNENIDEWLVEYEDGIRFFGAVQQDVLDDAALNLMWQQMKSSWLVLSPQPMSIAAIRSRFPQGWGDAGTLPPSDLLDMARLEDLLFVRCLEETPSNCIYLTLGAASAVETQLTALRGVR
jgi:hypothetical protein